MKDKIAVVILNYNGQNFLEKFLPTVIAYSKEAKIYVADNCSTDNSVTYLQSNFPEVALIQNQTNGGFAKGYNDALAQIEASYYVLLNSDIEVTENWLKPCIDLLDKELEIVAVQPKIMAYHNKKCFEHAGAAGGFLDQDFYPFCQGRIFEQTEEDHGQYNQNREIFWATGACLFIRSEAYHSVGGLDEDFFAHMEEIDLCWRLKSRGHKIYYCADSKIFHVGGGTLAYMNPKKTYLNFRNSLFMLTKNYSGSLFIKVFKRLILDGFAGGLFLVKFQFRHLIAVIKAHFHYYAKLPSLLKKRKIEKEHFQSAPLSPLYTKSIVFKSFVNGVKKFTDLNSKDFT